MRSPQGARFPSAAAGLFAAAVLVACTASEDPPTVVSPTTSADTGATGATNGNGRGDEPSTDGGRGSGIARVRDQDDRRTVRGEAPPYVEIESASVQGRVAESLTFSVELAGGIPQRMPDRRSILRVTFIVNAAGGKRYTFEAQCVRPGWGAFASGGPPDAPLPEIAIDGPRLDLTVDPAYMNGLQPFEWMVNVAWTSGEANYAFDAAPKRGFARYP